MFCFKTGSPYVALAGLEFNQSGLELCMCHKIPARCDNSSTQEAEVDILSSMCLYQLLQNLKTFFSLGVLF